MNDAQSGQASEWRPRWILHLCHVDGADAGEVSIPVARQEHDYRLRSLRFLVLAAADSFEYERTGDTISQRPRAFDDTPWHTALGNLILEHFRPELLRYLPQGRWSLGVCAAEE